MRRRSTSARRLEDIPTNRIVFLNQPGPGGGGGGGGNKSIEPPRLAQDIGRDKITVPVTKPPEIQPVKSPEDELPKIDFNIPAKAMASAEQSLVGVIDGMKSSNSTHVAGTGERRRGRHGHRDRHRAGHRLRPRAGMGRRLRRRRVSPGLRHRSFRGCSGK